MRIRNSCQGLKWLILQTENSLRRLQSDLNALQKWCGDSWHEVAESLLLHTLETDRDGILNLSDPRVTARLETAIQMLKPDVIGFDPLRDLMIGDPNSDADMAATLAMIGAISRRGNKQRAIVLLHHALTESPARQKLRATTARVSPATAKCSTVGPERQINIAPGMRATITKPCTDLREKFKRQGVRTCRGSTQSSLA